MSEMCVFWQADLGIAVNITWYWHFEFVYAISVWHIGMRVRGWSWAFQYIGSSISEMTFDHDIFACGLGDYSNHIMRLKYRFGNDNFLWHLACGFVDCRNIPWYWHSISEMSCSICWQTDVVIAVSMTLHWHFDFGNAMFVWRICMRDCPTHITMWTFRGRKCHFLVANLGGCRKHTMILTVRSRNCHFQWQVGMRIWGLP